MLEKQIEKKGNDYAKSLNVTNYKFTSPGHSGVPDRIYIREIPLFLRTLIAKYIRFVEYKREGQKPTGPQSREHLRLQALGFRVDVVDSVEDAQRVINDMVDE
jgi:hypothetical protein